MNNAAHIAELAGVRFRPSNYDDVEFAVDHALASDDQNPLTIGYINPHVVTTAESHPAIAEHLLVCDHVFVDGTGVWLALRLWTYGIERLTAYRAADQLLDGGVLRGTIAIIGIEPELLGRTSEEVASRNADVDIVGTAHGFSTDAEISDMLARSNPRIVLIGAGSPRSEQIASVVRSSCPNAIIFHLGAGTLKAWAGERSNAPQMLSRLGVEWLYRLVREPHTRERYWKGIPAFVRSALAGSRSVVVEETSDIRRTEGIFS